MFCNACGKKNPDHVQFCSACGAALHTPTVAVPGASQNYATISAPTPPQYAPSYAYLPQQPSKKKSTTWIVALVLIPVLLIGIIAAVVWLDPFKLSNDDPGYDEPGYNEPEDNGPDGPGSAEISDMEIQTAYLKAREAMNWFDGLNFMPLVGNGIEQNGRTYFEVNHSTIKTMADLTNYLKSLFTDDIVSGLLFSDTFTEIGGKLYQADGGRGGDLFAGEETYSVIRESDTKIIFQVKVEELGDDFETVIGYKTYDMVFEYISGKWVFSQFELVR